MGIILDLLEYIHVNKDQNTMQKRKKHIRERVKKYLDEIDRPLFSSKSPPPQWCLIRTVVQPVYRLSIMVSTDIS
jgi:hypothetical protein